MKYGLPEKDLEEILTEIQGHLGETKNPEIFVYGSRVKGGYRKYSDVDLLLKADSYDRASLELVDFQKLDTPYKVDLVLEPDLYEGYREEVFGHMEKVF